MKFVKLLQTTFVASCVVFGAVSTVQANGEAELAKAKQVFFKKDYKAHFKYLEKAAKKGNTEAEFLMGVAYAKGLGVKQDGDKASKLILDSCERKGYQEACRYIDSIVAEQCSNGYKPACNVRKFAK